EQVTSVDVDLYLTEIARKRLSEAGVAPTLDTVDATGDLPYEPASFDRIVATVSVRTIPAGWLRVLRPGGRLVTTIAGTSLLVTAEKDEDGGATGRVVVTVASVHEPCPVPLEAPGIEHDFREDGAQRVALMAHADGSWARATATGNERP
ncbi:methyltransferase domain-containing protein, partial [Streptomyces rhizosphaericus]|uniref:methyltransferase domain-containing protein n=1 Tax=Streptomyces rhizosphaericus TaxID=114699 RepID=UPI001FC92615